jgi:hypothetical protein
MGGWGSGRRGASKETTGDYRKRDVRKLQKAGMLEWRGSFSWQWTRNGEPRGNINIRPESDCVILNYRNRQRGEEWTEQEYAVMLERTPCLYGGDRVWFRCPAGGCGRRVAILYGGRVFACRHCLRLAYPCQHESPGDRADCRAWKIREHCGGWGSLLDPLFRRKGMHHRTFRRLARAYEQACSASEWAFSVKMGMSLDEVLRLAE